jgi:hypothetical protein
VMVSMVAVVVTVLMVALCGLNKQLLYKKAEQAFHADKWRNSAPSYRLS